MRPCLELVGMPEAAFNRKPSGLTLPFLLSKWPLALTQAWEGGLGALFWALACVLVCDRGRERKGERERLSL